MIEATKLSEAVVSDFLLRAVRTAAGVPTIEYEQPPRRLAGGFWAQLLVFQLRGAPPPWQSGLVARVMPDPWIAAKESAVQAELAAQGYPTPAVHLCGGPDDGLGQAYMVMDLAPGLPMLTGLSGSRALLAVPRLARRLPDVLAEAMARLHQVDVVPVQARLALAGIVELGMNSVLAGLRAGSVRCSRDDLLAAADWLISHPPAPAPEVVCHGDLHPFNVLVDVDWNVTVLDWSAAVIAPSLYDVAFTGLLLAEPPLEVPAFLRPAVRAAARLLAARFRRSYSRRTHIKLDRETVTWYEAVVCLRALVEVAGWVEAADVDAHPGHPWLVSGRAFASRLSVLTGTEVLPR